MMPSIQPWDLNPIVLCHVNRFFGAAHRAVESIEHDDILARLAAFEANMLWARSGFEASTPEQEKAMAYLGAAAGAFVDKLDLVDNQTKQAAKQALDDLERQLLTNIDTLLETLAHNFNATSLNTTKPGAMDAWVWQSLFPGYPWAVGQSCLEAAIVARLGG